VKTILAVLALVCGLASVAAGQTVTMPKEVTGDVGRLLSLSLEFDGDDVRWTASRELDLFREYDPDAKKIRLRLIAYKAGMFEVKAITTKDKKLSDFATTVIIVGGSPPVPPTPVPPTPVPPTPDPTPPFAVKGPRALILEETADRGKLPLSQLMVLTSTNLRSYLNSSVLKGPDGKTPEWRQWDDDYTDAQTKLDSEAWSVIYAKAKADAKGVTPWVFFVDANGRATSQALPATEAETIELLRKAGGP